MSIDWPGASFGSWTPPPHHTGSVGSYGDDPIDPWCSGTYRFRLAVPTSYAAGENPLLASGLALAAFSLESLPRCGRGGTPVSRVHALQYARQIFNFILESEVPGRGGYFLRIERYHPRNHPFLASMDETLGVCVGLRFFHEALTAAGEGETLEQVTSLVDRMARSMGAHGYWIFPWAEDYRRNSTFFKNAFYRWSGDKAVTTQQCGWAFGSAFRAFFRHVLGRDVRASWDGGERDAYCVPTISLGGADAILGWEDSRMVDGVAALPVDEDALLELMCGLLVKGWEIHDDGAPGGWTVVAEGIAAALATATGSPLAGLLDPLAIADTGRWALSKLYEGVADRFFNFHLIALATLLLMECGHPSVPGTVAKLMSMLLKSADGRKNALFGLVLGKLGGSAATETAGEVRDAVDVLTKLPTADGSEDEVMDHDLGLKRFDIEGELAGAVPEIAQDTGLPESAVSEGLKQLSVVDFNPYQRWGGAFWDTTAGKRPSGSCGFGDADRADKIALVELGRALFRGSDSRDADDKLLPVTQEVCSPGFLFARMLAAAWGVVPAPDLGIRDQLWATLPFFGAVALPERRPALVVDLVASDEFRPEKELVGLIQGPKGRRVSVRVPGNGRGEMNNGLGYRFGKDGFIHGDDRKTRPFFGWRTFRYFAGLRPDLLWIQLNGFGFRSQWEFYLELTDDGSAPSADRWCPLAQGDRIGALLKTPTQAVGNAASGYHLENTRTIETTAISGLLRSSALWGRLCLRFAPSHSSVGNDRIWWSTQPWPFSVRLGALRPDSPYPYVLNAHQGTIHQRNWPDHLKPMLDAYNAIQVPIRAVPRDSVLPAVMQALTQLQLTIPLKGRMDYSDNSVRPSKTRQWHLCPRCFT